MPNTRTSVKTISKTNRWLTAGSFALLIAAAGATGMALTSQKATAQVSVQVTAPASFADLVEAVKPAVVSISVAGEREVQNFGGRGDFNFQFPDLPDDHPFRRFFDQFEDQFNDRRGDPNQPRTRRFQAAGSGFVISEDGFVVTNNHVVDNATTVTVIYEDGEEHTATLIGTDPRTDLALLQIDDVSGLTYVEFSEQEARVGDWVVAVGNPFGLGGTVTAGIVSARGRDISANSYGDFIQIDAAVNHGNSGGPAFNLSGQVVGVNTAIFSPNGGNVGIAFAIPADTVQQVVFDLMDDGMVTRGFLGVFFQELTADISDSLGLDNTKGALVTSPTPDGPAGIAGIESGDVILRVDGEVIDDTKDLSRTIAQKIPGTNVEVIVWRNGQERTFTIELVTFEESTPVVEEPEVEEKPALPAPTSVGLTLMPAENGEGLVVQAVEAESPASAKGLRVGDILVQANNTDLNSVEDFENAVSAVQDSGRTTILLKASRNGNIRFIGLPL